MLKIMNPGQLFHELDLTKLEKFWKNNIVVKDFSVCTLIIQDAHGKVFFL